MILRRNSAPSGFTDLRLLGVTNAPAIFSLIAPNGTNYSSITFDGSNTEFETDTGDINIRNYNSSNGNVNIWSTNHTQKLRVGNSGFTQTLDLFHDGTNGTISTSTGSLLLQPSSNVALYNASSSVHLTVGNATNFRMVADAQGEPIRI